MQVTLWRSSRAGKPRGFWLASWREHGRKVSWNTRTEDRARAKELADAEWGRRRGAEAAPSAEEAPKPPAPPVATEPPPPAPAPTWEPPPTTAWPRLERPAGPQATTNGFRKPIADVLSRAMGAEPEASSSSSTPASTSGPPPGAGAEYVFSMFARSATFLTRVGLQKAVRLAGRDPDEMEESEEKMIEQGWKEIGARWFGQTELGPWGKIMMATTVAGVGMYIGGEPIDPPDDEPKALAAAPPAPEGASD